MKNKKIKVLLGIFLLILTLSVGSTVKAVVTSFQPQRGWAHTDIWTGHREFFGHVLEEGRPFATPTNNGVRVTQLLQLILCRQKGGAIRFTGTPSNLVTHQYASGVWCNDGCALGAKDQIKNSAKPTAKYAVEDAIEQDDSYKASTVVGGIYARYAGTYFPTVLMGDWDGDVYYSSFLYTIVPTYNAVGNMQTANNNIRAYIMSAGKDFAPTSSYFNFKKGNYVAGISDAVDSRYVEGVNGLDDKYQLIQDALWLTDFNEGIAYSNGSSEAYALVNEANEYERFYHNIVETGYENKVSTDKERAQVIVNRNDQNEANSNYIMGPFRITYPDQNPFSYIEDMYIIAKNSAEGTQVEVRNFEVITASGARTYPSNNEEFYVKFNAKEAGYPTSADIRVRFAYLANCGAQYQYYEGQGEVYQVRGRIYEDEHGKHKYKYPDKEWTGKYDEDGDKIYQDVEREGTHASYGWYYDIYTEKIGDYPAQKLAILAERNREWKRYEVSVTGGDMDLTMELGGIVWEDTKGGKETDNDNVYDPSKALNNQTDRLMPNVVVTLYNKDGSVAKLVNCANPTKTDSNGRYKFTGINAMFQYYVQFTYNSQYYEPVEYVSPNDNANGWAKGTWKINSNGTDVQIERENINARFASIGSSPRNYKGTNGYNKTYSKNELLGLKLDENGNYVLSSDIYIIIDEFGNLLYNANGQAMVKDASGREILVSSLTGDRKTDVDSKIQFVKDCQLSSYTGKDNGSKVRSNDLYPIYSSFVIDDHKEREVLSILATRGYVDAKIPVLYENDAQYYINQGYTLRRLVDVALRKDIQNVYMQINGKEHTYDYNTRKAVDESSVINPNGTPKGDTTWDINIRLSDHYYDATYSREVHPSDYEYKVGDYNGKANAYGKTEDSELKVYITYKITLKNQSLSVRTRIDEIVDYYDKDLVFDTQDQYILNNSYMQINIGENAGRHNIGVSSTSRYHAETMTNIEGYHNLYVQFADDIYLKTGQTAYLYLTFRVDKDGNRNVLLDEENWKLDANGNIVATAIGVGKENIAEINGYSTIYADGTTVPNVGDVSGKAAGLIDRDSNPGNLNPVDVPKDGNVQYKNFEDDTDKSPNIKLKLSTFQEENRVVDGIVWEDIRNVTNNTQKTTVANGIMDNGETGINGVTVQLVEVMDNGTEHIWKTFSTGQGSYEPIMNKLGLVTTVNDSTAGKYVFKSYPAGNYVVRFIYGDTIKTVLPNSNTDITALLGQMGQNAKSYTGQDYKSTSYQVNIPEGKSFTFRNETIYSNNNVKFSVNESGKFVYDITASDTNANVSDAKDMMRDTNRNVDNSRPDATLNSREDVENYSKENVTNHIAEVLASHDQLQEYYRNNKDKVNELLQELMNKTAMTAETGVMDIEIEKDTKETPNQTNNNTLPYQIKNVNLGLEERPKAQLAINKEITNVKLTLADGSVLFDAKQTASNVLWKDHKEYEVGYKSGTALLDEAKFGNVENIRKKNANDARFGLIQLSMDEELMHGATIKISYKVTVTNVGEVDYDDDMFYYTGTTSNTSKVVKTRANQVMDYVANNLQFNANEQDNSSWEVIKVEDVLKQNEELVNANLSKEVEQYNTIIITKQSSNIAQKELVPVIYDKNNSQVSDNLVLTQLITAENDTDNLTYRNIVEIVKTSNTVGRRNVYSVVGNQNPTKEPQELDSDRAEIVRILPPFGNGGIYIIIAITTIVAVGILVGGVIFIKKKVLK